MADVEVFFNPSCSKCRTVRGMLEERGVDVEYVRYLAQAPTRDKLEEVLGMLGTDDPRAIVRTGESLYGELSLATADREGLLEAMVQHPRLIQRPIVIKDGRAVVARPPERALELFDD